jgi:asparagine synthase (glutamine-hydrolysing)
MCGIAGSFEQTAPDPAVSAEQLRLLAHRGPDASGTYSSPLGSISQSRLSIVDVDGGDPPISNEDGSIAAVLNGEIYNFAALRAELERRGHEFTTQCDTEVLVHLAEEHAPRELAAKLDGMFAFALWDGRRGRLVLGRDRCGKKPMYYWCGAGKLVFGSEIKAVLAHPQVPRRLNPRAIAPYLACGYVPSPETFFDEIVSLMPGHVLEYAGGETALQAFWRPPVPGVNCDPIMLSTGDAAAELRALLEAAVERRRLGDVPIGAFLSGGIDSSAMVALLARTQETPVQTFTIGFEDSHGFDERPYARLVAAHCRTEHTEFVVQPQAVDLIERLVWHHDQPFGDSSAIPTFLLSELTSKHVKVAISGDGGDELFAGYERFAAATAVEAYRTLPEPTRGAVFAALERIPPDRFAGRAGSAQRFAARAGRGLPEAYMSWLAYVPEPWRVELLGADDGAGLDGQRAVWSDSDGARLLDRLLNFNFRTYLLDDLLVKTDRMCMAHGLEVRSPLLDTALVEFALRLPPATKMRGVSLKRVLKRAVADLVPATTLRRRKRGFGVPLGRWFRTDLRGYAGSMLGPGARVRGHLSGEALDQLLRRHAAGSEDRGHAIWTLLTLEVFLRREGW